MSLVVPFLLAFVDELFSGMAETSAQNAAHRRVPREKDAAKRSSRKAEMSHAEKQELALETVNNFQLQHIK